MRVALLGGSFNPPHVGHVMAALYVRATQPVDVVWMMPSFRHPFGKALVDFEHRARMCDLVAKDLAGWLQVCRVEQTLGGEGRTVDTLEHLVRMHPDAEFTLVIGSDIVKDLPSWKQVDRIRSLARVLVLNRAGHPAPEAVGPPLVEVSSTEVRQRLESNQLPETLVPRVVLEYARQHGLYGLSRG